MKLAFFAQRLHQSEDANGSDNCFFCDGVRAFRVFTDGIFIKLKARRMRHAQY